MQLHERIGRRLRLRDLNIFLVVATERNMSKAAVQLAISQPAVSKAITEMELTLGVPLLDRGPRGVEPTLFGRALLKRSAAIFDELRQTVTDIDSLLDPTRESLHEEGAWLTLRFVHGDREDGNRSLDYGSLGSNSENSGLIQGNGRAARESTRRNSVYLVSGDHDRRTDRIL